MFTYFQQHWCNLGCSAWWRVCSAEWETESEGDSETEGAEGGESEEDEWDKRLQRRRKIYVPIPF